MVYDGLQKVMRAYRISLWLWVGWAVFLAGVVLLLADLLTGGTYPLADGHGWNLAISVGLLIVGAVITAIGVAVTVRALRKH